jgi:hypothetical protein
MAPLHGLSPRKVRSIIEHRPFVVRIEEGDFIRRGLIAAHRWLAEHHRKEAARHAAAADAKEAASLSADNNNSRSGNTINDQDSLVARRAAPHDG